MSKPSVRSLILTRRTYNRPLNEEGTVFESWNQTIDRVIGHQRWLWETAQDSDLDENQEAELSELRSIILNRKASVAGRTLWLGGTDVAKKRAASNFNCVRKSTQFITNKGVKSFNDFNDGDECVVLTHKNRWKKATVRSYGEQRLFKIDFARGSSLQAVFATENHRWILADGTTSEGIQVKQKIARPDDSFNRWEYEDAIPQERLYWAYGFVYGDGTLVKNKAKEVVSSMVRLCGDKNRFVERFQELGFPTSQPPSCNGDHYVYTGKYFKTLPNPEVDSVEMCRAFVRGYLDADGNKGRSGNPNQNPFTGIQVTGEEGIEFVRKVFPMVGVYITNEQEITNDTNHGPRSKRTVHFGLSSGFGASSNGSNYSVVDVQPAETEEVWCLEVEEDHSFTLPNGIVTGNCSFIEVRTVHDLVDVFWLLLQGCGVGFKPVNGTLSGFTRKMEVEIVRSTRTGDGGQVYNSEVYDQSTKTWTITVGDSAESWAKAIGKIVAGKFPAKKIIVDLTPIRAPGKRLKGYGWICTGDEQLSVAIKSICDIMNRCVGKLLRKNDIIDIINWLGTVLSNRRSAQIALMDYGDPEWREFATRKYKGFDAGPNWYRSQSNNSLIFWDRPTKKQLNDLFELMISNGGSEPGFVNGVQATIRAPWFRGLNPCIPSDQWIMTSNGPRTVADLVGKPFVAVVDGSHHESTQYGFFKSGKKPVFRVTLESGHSFRCTENHRILACVGKGKVFRKIPLSDLAVGSSVKIERHIDSRWSGPGDKNEGWLLGSFAARGVVAGDGASLRYRGGKFESRYRESESVFKKATDLMRIRFGETVVSVANKSCVASYETSASPGLLRDIEKYEYSDGSFGSSIEGTSSEFQAGFVSGFFDTIGKLDPYKRINAEGRSKNLLLLIQRMLSRFGVFSFVSKNDFYKWDNENSDPRYVIRIDKSEAKRFSEVFGLNGENRWARLVKWMRSEDAPKLRTTCKIANIEPDGFEDVYDCTIYDASRIDVNGVSLAQCGEILLPSNGFCNLVEIPVNKYKGDEHGLMRSTELIARANYRQTVVDLRDGVLQDSWHQQNEYLRLCGVGLTGITCRPDMTKRDYNRIRDMATFGAYSMARELNLEFPKNVTTMKPSGTLSKAIFDTTEGAHKPKGRYIFNTVSFSKYDPLVSMLAAANYSVMDHPYDTTAKLIVLPVQYQDVQLDRWNGYDVDRESAVAQLSRYRMLQNDYVQQNTSITVSYDPSEKNAIIKTMVENWDDYVACSFLFRDDPTLTAEDLGYAYMPQRVVSEAEFSAYNDNLLAVDIESVHETGIFELKEEKECAGGACPTK